MSVPLNVFALLSVASLIVAICSATTYIGCDSADTLQDVINTEELEFDYSGNIKTFDDVSISSIVSTINNDFEKVYIDATLEEDDYQTNLIIFTTDHFGDYVREQSSTKISLTIHFECPGGSPRTLLFVQPIKEGNYFAPEFDKDSYVLIVPTPLFQGFELTMFEKISAVDYDLTGNDITFSSTNSELNLLTGLLEKREKTSFVSLKLRSTLFSFTEDIEFFITATDNGKPPRSSSPTKVTITWDTSNSIPPVPTFTRAIVYGSLTDDLRLNELELILKPETYSRDVSFKKLSDEDDIFELESSANVVHVSLAKQLDSEFLKEKEILTLVVEATNAKLKETGRTAVSVLLPKKQDHGFKEGLYKGKLIAKRNKLDIEGLEISTNANDLDEIDFELEGEYKKSFDIMRRRNIIMLSLKSSVKPNVWANISYVSLKLSAKLDSVEIASTNIIIDVVHTQLSFDKSMHFGSISSDGRLVLDPITLQSNEKTTDDVRIQLLPTDADIFLFDKTGNEIRLKLKKDAEIEFDNKTLFRTEVVAEQKVTGVRAVCVVLVTRTIAKKEYRFKEGIYKGNLIAKRNRLDIDAFEILTNTNQIEKIDFELEGQFMESFQIKPNKNIITLSLKSSLKPNVWTNVTYVSLKLTAKIDLEEVATANIIIDVVHTTLWFDKSTFIGSISSDGSLVLDPIKLQSSEKATDDVKIQLLQADAELFSFNKIGNEIRLKLKENIGSGLEDVTLTRLEVVAEEMSTGVRASCVVLIERAIVEKVYRFKKGVYKGKLIPKTNRIDIEDFDIFTNTNDLDDMEFELEGQFQESFQFDQRQNTITLSLKSDLKPNVWTNTGYVSLKLSAKLDSEEIASTSIILDVIHTQLSFGKSTYLGSITSDDKLVLDPIKLQSSERNTDDVKIQLLAADADIFLFDKAGNEIRLKLKNDVQTELENKTMLRLEVVAEEMLTGVRAVCVVLLERAVIGKEYRFKEGLYRGELLAKTNMLDIDDFEIVTNMNELDAINFELEGQDKQSFEIKQHQTFITLSIKSDSQPNAWSNITYVALKLTAKIDSEDIASTSIVIDVVHTTLSFDQAIYFGSISSDSNLILDPIELQSNEKTTDDVEIQLLQTDSELFSFDKVGNEIRLELRESVENEPENKTLFRLEVAAEEMVTGARALCVVLIERAIVEKEYRFKEGLYKGKLVAKTNNLDIADAEFFTNTKHLEDISFELRGAFNELFETKRQQNVVELSLRPNLSRNVLANTTYVSLHLLAKLNSEEIASTILIIDVVHTTLWFDKSIYFGSISSSDSLVLDPIQLQSNADTTDDVSIQLLHTDAELFTFDKVGNEISLRLRDNIASELENKTMFRLEIEAEEMVTGVRAACVVLIGKTVDGKVMKFGQNFYESEISNDPQFVFDIDLDKESYTEDTVMSVSGQYADLFNIRQVANRLSLSLKDTFSLNDFNTASYLWLEVKASSLMKKLEAWTVVVFRLIQDETPEFEQHAYIGTLTKANVFELPTLVIKRSTWTASTFVEVIGNYSEYFESNLTENELRISLKSELPDDVKVRNSIVLVALASNGHARGFTTVVVNLPLSRSLSNIFKKIIQSGRIAHNETVQEMEMPDIELVDEYNVADFNCTLNGDEVTYFDFSVVSPKNVIKLGLSSKIPEEIIHERLYLVVSLECQHKTNDLKSGSTILFLTLPGTNGCPTPDPVTYVPEFPKRFYSFYAKPSFVGSLQRVRAIIRESEDDIRYSLDISNEHLSSRLGIDGDTGEMFISAAISPGTYFFKIAAANMVTQGQTKVNCRLDVEALIQCEDHAVVSNSLLTKYLKEETEYDDILNTAVGDCKFTIFSVAPNDQEYVYIDPVFNVLRMTPTDRESPIFADMSVPQIEVKLKLDCLQLKNATATRSVLRSARDLGSQSLVSRNMSVGFTEDIAFAKDVTVLSIILTDINDNHPVFVHPKHTRQVVGYPRDENLMDLFSECLIQVRATDNDEGLNRQIRYTIQPNKHFQIDARTGKVYPLANAMAGISEIDIVVYATDRDGASDGLSANFTLTVKVLTADHFLLLSFESRHIEHVDSLVESASNKTGLSLVLVRHATVSLANGSALANQRTLESGPDRFISKLWVYALKDNAPVSSKIIKQLLSRSENISAQSVKDLIAVAETVTQVCSYDATGYICGLVILALLVVVCIGLIFWKHIRSYIKSDDDASEDYFTSRGPPNPNFQKKPKSAEMKSQKQRQLAPDPSYYGRRDTTGAGLQDARDIAKRSFNQNVNGSVYEMSYDSESQSTSGSSNESMRPRATVTFNELVQRIHIDDDAKMKY